MKNEQLKDQSFPNRVDLQRPVFTWMKTALVEDKHIIWWLFYGNAAGKRTLCHRVFQLKNKPLNHRRRLATAFALRSNKQQLLREWREHYPEATP